MSNSNESSRRDFIKQASLIGAAAVAAPTMLNAFPLSADDGKGENYTFLFQGDSITDGNRTRNLDWNHVLGHGYAYLIAAKLWFEKPEKKFHFFNRGVSGNKVTDLVQRWQDDTIAIKPDLLSILIGVNDTTSTVKGNTNFSIASYEENYRALLLQTKQQLPNVQLVIMEPFISSVGNVKAKWDDYYREITGRQAVANKLAGEFDAIFVPLQDEFNKITTKYPPNEYWVWDGVHPMPNGHELMAREWIKHVSKKIKFIK